MSVIVVVGNPKPQSRTLRAGQLVAESLTGQAPDRTIDLAEYGSDLLDFTAQSVTDAVSAVVAAGLVVIASPTYKASYTGLLKVFLDRFGAGSLNSVVAIPLMLGGDLRHSLAPEVFLKPVLAELGASTPTRGLFLLDTGAESNWADSAILTDWLAVARRQLPADLLDPAGAR